MIEEATPVPPEFGAWSHENLAAYAKEAYVRIKLLEAACEQYKSDLHYAMEIARGNYGHPRKES